MRTRELTPLGASTDPPHQADCAYAGGAEPAKGADAPARDPCKYSATRYARRRPRDTQAAPNHGATTATTSAKTATPACLVTKADTPTRKPTAQPTVATRPGTLTSNTAKLYPEGAKSKRLGNRSTAGRRCGLSGIHGVAAQFGIATPRPLTTCRGCAAIAATPTRKTQTSPTHTLPR
jgi:hypothetical protein